MKISSVRGNEVLGLAPWNRKSHVIKSGTVKQPHPSNPTVTTVTCKTLVPPHFVFDYNSMYRSSCYS